MILVDTSVWIDHLHTEERALMELLEQTEVRCHPMAVAELALGTIKNRDRVIGLLNNLPGVTLATHGEVAHLLETRVLYGKGLSVVGVHLLAAVQITEGVWLWTRDKRLRSAAKELGVAATWLT